MVPKVRFDVKPDWFGAAVTCAISSLENLKELTFSDFKSEGCSLLQLEPSKSEDDKRMHLSTKFIESPSNRVCRRPSKFRAKSFLMISLFGVQSRVKINQTRFDFLWFSVNPVVHFGASDID